MPVICIDAKQYFRLLCGIRTHDQPIRQLRTALRSPSFLPLRYRDNPQKECSNNVERTNGHRSTLARPTVVRAYVFMQYYSNDNHFRSSLVNFISGNERVYVFHHVFY